MHHIKFFLLLPCLIKEESQHLQGFALDFELIGLDALEDEDDEGIEILVPLQEEILTETSACIPKDHLHQTIDSIILLDVPSVRPSHSFLLHAEFPLPFAHHGINRVNYFAYDGLGLKDPFSAEVFVV